MRRQNDRNFDRSLNKRIQFAYLAILLIQILHSVEEFATRMFDVFPPALIIDHYSPGLSQAIFVTFNSSLIVVMLIAFFYWVKPRRRGWRLIVAMWVVGEAYNAVGHSLWSIWTRSYTPGLLTALALIPLVVWLIYLLRNSRKSGLVTG